jgi:soluble lytic murein transglycosylase-like protein
VGEKIVGKTGSICPNRPIKPENNQMQISDRMKQTMARVEEIRARIDALSSKSPPLQTGSLAPVGFPAGSTPPPGMEIRSEWEPLIQQAATQYGLDADLLRRVVDAESNGDPNAVSPKGARGLMQLMPATAQALGVENPFDPEQNIDGGARYLRHLLDTFGDVRLALAAYNAGPGNVRKYSGVPPFPETQRYVRKILGDG